MMTVNLYGQEQPADFEEVEKRLNEGADDFIKNFDRFHKLAVDAARLLWQGMNIAQTCEQLSRENGDSISSLRTFLNRHVIHPIRWNLTWRSTKQKLAALRVRAQYTQRMMSPDLLGEFGPSERKSDDVYTVLDKLGPNPDPIYVQVATQLWRGKNKLEMQRLFKLGTAPMGDICAKIGWNRSWRARAHMPAQYLAKLPSLTGKNHLSAQVADILYTKHNFTLQELGDLAGVSRERIRQVLASVGHRTAAKEKAIIRRSQAAERQELAKLSRRSEQKRKVMNKYSELDHMWRTGKHFSDIAKYVTCSPATLRTEICRLRARYGLFPYRATVYLKKTPEELAVMKAAMEKKYARELELWMINCPLVEIANATGAKPHTLAAAISRNRKKYGLFPLHVRSGRGYCSTDSGHAATGQQSDTAS